MSIVTHCMLGHFSWFCFRLLITFKINVKINKKNLLGTLPMSNSLDPDQDWRSVGRDQGQKLFAKFINRPQNSPLASKEVSEKSNDLQH